jgi:hypothetical protein
MNIQEESFAIASTGVEVDVVVVDTGDNVEVADTGDNVEVADTGDNFEVKLEVEAVVEFVEEVNPTVKTVVRVEVDPGTVPGAVSMFRNETKAPRRLGLFILLQFLEAQNLEY